MSYILDALKKSEKAQKSNNLRILTTEESALVEPIQNDPSFKRAILLVTLSFVFLAVLVVLIWFLFTIKNNQVNESKSQSSTQQTAVAKQSNNSASQAVKQDTPNAPNTQDVSIAGSVSSNDSSGFEANAQAPETPSNVADLAVIDSEIPSALAQLEINVLSYAPTPSRRFVMMDNKTYKEGSEVIIDSQKVKIVEIRQDGVVLEYQNNNYLKRP